MAKTKKSKQVAAKTKAAETVAAGGRVEAAPSLETANLVAALDTVAARLDAAVAAAGAAATPRIRDAIDRELGRPGRATAVVSVRESAEFQKVRQEFVDGQIRQDAVLRLLSLVDLVVKNLWLAAAV